MDHVKGNPQGVVQHPRVSNRGELSQTRPDRARREGSFWNHLRVVVEDCLRGIFVKGIANPGNLTFILSFDVLVHPIG